MKRFSLLVAFLLVPAAGAVSFNEVTADPEGRDDNREWIEFSVENETNLTGWNLVENGVSHTLRPVGNDTVPAGSLFLLADDAGWLVNETRTNVTVFDTAMSLRNTGEELTMTNGSYNISLTYDEIQEGSSFCLREKWERCEPSPGEVNLVNNTKDSGGNFTEEENGTEETSSGGENVMNGDGNGSETSEGTDEIPMEVVSYPSSLRFGSTGHVTIRTEPGEVHVYGWPEKVVTGTDGERIGAFSDEAVIVGRPGYVSVPFRLYPNCDDHYSNGEYRLRVRLSREGEEIVTDDIFTELYGSGVCGDDSVEGDGKEEAGEGTKEVEVKIVESPRTVEIGENFTVRTVILGEGEMEVYSYLREGSRLASEGGWTANRQHFMSDGFSYRVLRNVPSRDGNLTLTVRMRRDDEKYDAVTGLEVVRNVEQSPPERTVSGDDDEQENITAKLEDVRGDQPEEREGFLGDLMERLQALLR